MSFAFFREYAFLGTSTLGGFWGTGIRFVYFFFLAFGINKA
jgi:hypothetical protein